MFFAKLLRDVYGICSLIMFALITYLVYKGAGFWALTFAATFAFMFVIWYALSACMVSYMNRSK